MGIAHDFGQFGMHNTNQRLPWRKRTDHFFANGLFLDGSNELLDHRQGHIGLQQGHAHFAQGIGDIGFSQSSLALQRLHDAGKAVGQVIEHVT